MADFALDEVVDMENLRALYANSQLSDEDAFDHGLIDSTGGVNFNIDEYVSDSFTDEDFINDIEKYVNTLSKKEQRDTFDMIRKYNKKWSMLRGMMKQSLKDIPLTTKQKKWLKTNITFSVEDFPNVCKNDPKFREKIEYYWKLTTGQVV